MQAEPLGAPSSRVKTNRVDLAGDTLGCAYSIVTSDGRNMEAVVLFVTIFVETYF